MVVRMDLKKKFDLFYRFNKQFWVVNTFELFERGAYYGMMAIFGYHFIYNIGIADPVVGLALGVLMPLLYFMPLISATLAEKYGYKPAFIISFIIIIIGYFGLYISDGIVSLFASVIALGIGAGAFKPMVSATIAHVTEERDRNYAYSIYYWMINLGAFLMPLIIGIYIEGVLDDPSLYALAFLISCFLIGINLVICFTMFKEPAEPKRDKKIVTAFKDLVFVMKDRTFVTLLLIYAGFWFMFSLNHSFLPVYMVDFGLKPEWFAIPWIGIINPGTIIFAGPFLSKMVDVISDRFSSLQLMITGMSIFIVGLLVIAFVKVFILAALGIVIFSVGEFLTHPNFISYVSKIAPKDKVAMYMGYAFIPTGIGYTAGSVASGYLYAYFSVSMQRPTIFWTLIACVGVVTVAMMLLYNRFMVSEKDRRDREKAIAEGDVSAAQPIKKARTLWNSKITPLAVLCLVPILISASLIPGSDEFYREDEDGGVGKDIFSNFKDLEATASMSGSATEGQGETETVQAGDLNLYEMTFTLTWTDEPDSTLHNNLPDTFQLEVTAPDGRSESGTASNPEEGTGEIELVFQRNVTKEALENKDLGKKTKDDVWTGDWNISITLTEAGDQEAFLSPGPFRDQPDNGNDWSLDIQWKFKAKKGK